MAENGKLDSLVKLLTSLTVVCLGILAAAFWRWADVVNVRSNDILDRLDEIRVDVATTAVKVDTLTTKMAEHDGQYAHDGATQALNDAAARLDRIRGDVMRLDERVDQLEGDIR